MVDMVLYSAKFLSAANFVHNNFTKNYFCWFIFGHHCDIIFCWWVQILKSVKFTALKNLCCKVLYLDRWKAIQKLLSFISSHCLIAQLTILRGNVHARTYLLVLLPVNSIYIIFLLLLHIQFYVLLILLLQLERNLITITTAIYCIVVIFYRVKFLKAHRMF